MRGSAGVEEEEKEEGREEGKEEEEEMEEKMGKMWNKRRMFMPYKALFIVE